MKTRGLAERIGDAYDVDPDCLLANSLSRGLYTSDGQRWTKETWREVKAQLARWGDLEPYARQRQRAITAGLLGQYLWIAHLIRQLPDPSEQMSRWEMLFQLAIGALIHAEQRTEKLTGQDYFCHDRLESLELSWTMCRRFFPKSD